MFINCKITNDARGWKGNDLAWVLESKSPNMYSVYDPIIVPGCSHEALYQIFKQIKELWIILGPFLSKQISYLLRKSQVLVNMCKANYFGKNIEKSCNDASVSSLASLASTSMCFDPPLPSPWQVKPGFLQPAQNWATHTRKRSWIHNCPLKNPRHCILFCMGGCLCCTNARKTVQKLNYN